MIDKQSPYLNSFVINIGSNKGIKMVWQFWMEKIL